MNKIVYTKNVTLESVVNCVKYNVGLFNSLLAEIKSVNKYGDEICIFKIKMAYLYSVN
jgi:hypothetical protein